MSEFKYKIFQRVIVPGEGEIQGVIVGLMAENSQEPRYQVVWLKIALVSGRSEAVNTSNTFRESVIATAQPPKMVEQAAADRMILEARANVSSEFREKLADALTRVDRLEAAAKRRRKRR